jgi:hypothetical protein
MQTKHIEAHMASSTNFSIRDINLTLIMTLSIKFMIDWQTHTLSIKTLIKMTLSIRALSIMTLSIMTPRIKSFIMTLTTMEHNSK